jgi:hypothetical protein
MLRLRFIPPFGREFLRHEGVFQSDMSFFLAGRDVHYAPRPRAYRLDEPLRIIPRRVALQQSPPPFHPAVSGYHDSRCCVTADFLLFGPLGRRVDPDGFG